MKKPKTLISAVLASLLGAAAWPAAAAAGAPPDVAGGGAPDRVEFNRHVRPILSAKCFACHGPDEKARKSGLRLDQRPAALAERKGRAAIVPGSLERSELARRIAAADPAERMPPPGSGHSLTGQEIETLRRWIAAGAGYEAHWSLIAPRRPPLPGEPAREVPAAAPPVAEEARNAVDYYIRARLREEGLAPSPPADRRTLARRLSLDLLGLPPEPAGVEAFVADAAPDAYERLAERVLASPHHGERVALEWLDAARYADTHGYHIDSGRDMTRWREWVIDSLNANLPFDRFTVEQLAGDLLPEATLEQKIASGFNRNHMINFEGGAIPEEYQTAYIVDRVNTTGTVWLGLTLGCSQCHDHKFDPVTQKEYYGLYAFFHNVPENGLDGNKGNAAPLIAVPTAAQAAELERLAAAVASLDGEINRPRPDVDAAQAAWESASAAEKEPEWTVLKPARLASEGGATLATLDDGSVAASGANPDADTYTVMMETGPGGITAIRLEALPHEGLPSGGPGRAANGNLVLTGFRAAAGPAGTAALTPLAIKTASADFSQKDFPISLAIDDKPATGWAIHPEVGKPHAAVFELAAPLAAGAAAHLEVTLDFRSGIGQHQLGRFRLAATTSTQPHGAAKLPAKVREALGVAAASRTPEQAGELRKYYRAEVAPGLKPLHEEAARLRRTRADLEKSIRTAMVMEEMREPRQTHVLMRGQYDKKGETVAAGVPACLPPLPPGAPHNRLGLARWLVDPSHPLTARVAVNRLWQVFFGIGIVRTAEDFGSQGEWPTHPELLDWLAVEFQESGWDVKRLERLFIGSAAYRQTSAVTARLLERDPENRLHARGGRFRLKAELIRDQALAAAGLLDGRLGGASVNPYQPPGLWEELAYRMDGANWTAQAYTQSHGADLYRRGMYTFWKRTSPPASFSTFDAPDRETCTVRRARTNTPLQALVLMNDPTYVEAARALAERLMTEAGPSTEARLDLAFRLTIARPPRPPEAAALSDVFTAGLAAFRGDPAAAQKLLSVGESRRNETLDAAELAAWTTAASVVLNLDETLTRS